MHERKQKTVYAYHPETGEYLGETLAELSPLDLDEVWLIPAHATEDPPPKSQHQQTPCYYGGEWRLAPDHRDQTLWSKLTAQRVRAQLGETPDSIGATTLEPPTFPVWSGDGWSVDANAHRAAQAAAVDIEAASRRAAADAAITPLEDALELGMATTDELAALKVWKRCRVLLSRVPQQAGYPMAVDWPPSP